LAFAVASEAEKISNSSSHSMRRDPNDFCWYKIRLYKKFKPEKRFISFFSNVVDLGNEISGRPRSTRGSIIRSYRSARSKELSAKNACLFQFGQPGKRHHNPKCKFLCPILQFSGARHSAHPQSLIH